MRCPSLQELPPAPPGRSGWPWTAASPRLDNGDWPRVTIITPSYNQGEFIEETIRSVLLQGYPDLEYVIMDGGSSDNSVDIIKRYQPWLSYWTSEADGGQTHAINKGLARATGQLVAYLNSDDLYLPGTLATVVEAATENPRANWFCSACFACDESDGSTRILRPAIPTDPAEWLFKPSGQPYCFPQPGVFLRRSLVQDVGMFREDLRYSFDYEYFQRLLFDGHRPLELEATLAVFRLHSSSKTSSNAAGFAADDLAVADMYIDRVSPAIRKRLITQRRTYMAWRTVDRCAAVAQALGPRAGRRNLWQAVLHDPRLLLYRHVWGALRRWHGLGHA